MVLIGPAFVYYYDVFLQDDGDEPAILHIAITENVKFVLFRILATVCDGTVGVACIHRHIGSNARGVLVPSPSVVCQEVVDISLLQILCGSDFDPYASLIARNRSSEVDWAWIVPANR